MKELLQDFCKIVNAIASDNFRTVARDEEAGFIISTIWSPDCGYETALADKEQTCPVERYPDEDAARVGHAHWVQFIRDGGREITKLGYGNCIPDEKVILK